MKKFRTWVSAHKAGAVSVLVILGTICIFVSGNFQSDKADMQATLNSQIGLATVANSAFTADDSELQLQQSIASWCQTNPQTTIVEKGSCGSNRVLLQMAAEEHDPLEGNEIQAADRASSTLADYNVEIPLYDERIAVSGGLSFIFLFSSILVSLLA